MTRTQEEILARYNSVESLSLFGFNREVLAEAMTLESLATIGAEASEPGSWQPLAGDLLVEEAKGYLTFAIGKIEDHRGISAERSVDKLREYAWLMGRDEVVEAMDAAQYAQYGAPKVRAFAAGMGWPWPADSTVNAMANGEMCTWDCESGCGR